MTARDRSEITGVIWACNIGDKSDSGYVPILQENASNKKPLDPIHNVIPNYIPHRFVKGTVVLIEAKSFVIRDTAPNILNFFTSEVEVKELSVVII